MAWPADVNDGDYITHTLFNAVKNSVSSWGGTVEANGNVLNNAVLYGRQGSRFLSLDAAQNGYITIGRLASEATLAVAASDGQFAAGAKTGDFVFRSEGARVCLGVGGTETLTLEAAGVVKITGLPSTNPGAGKKQLWYDPADGNRVKYAV